MPPTQKETRRAVFGELVEFCGQFRLATQAVYFSGTQEVDGVPMHGDLLDSPFDTACDRFLRLVTARCSGGCSDPIFTKKNSKDQRQKRHIAIFWSILLHEVLRSAKVEQECFTTPDSLDAWLSSVWRHLVELLSGLYDGFEPTAIDTKRITNQLFTSFVPSSLISEERDEILADFRAFITAIAEVVDCPIDQIHALEAPWTWNADSKKLVGNSLASWYLGEFAELSDLDLVDYNVDTFIANAPIKSLRPFLEQILPTVFAGFHRNTFSILEGWRAAVDNALKSAEILTVDFERGVRMFSLSTQDTLTDLGSRKSLQLDKSESGFLRCLYARCKIPTQWGIELRDISASKAALQTMISGLRKKTAQLEANDLILTDKSSDGSFYRIANNYRLEMQGSSV